MHNELVGVSGLLARPFFFKIRESTANQKLEHPAWPDACLAGIGVRCLAKSLECAKISPMLIPRFSLRWLMLALAGASLLAFTARQAVFGQSWALAVMASIVTLAFTFLVYIGVFSAAWMVATFVGLAKRSPAPESPFATSKAPPQVIAPTSPDLDE